MKTVNDIADNEVSKILDDRGAFFAFSNSQFNEKKVEGVKYANLGGGLVCPVATRKGLWSEIDKCYKSARDKILSLYGKEKVIHYELMNHECYYTGDCSEAVEVLTTCYDITEDEVRAQFSRDYLKYVD